MPPIELLGQYRAGSTATTPDRARKGASRECAETRFSAGGNALRHGSTRAGRKTGLREEARQRRRVAPGREAMRPTCPDGFPQEAITLAKAPPLDTPTPSRDHPADPRLSPLPTSALFKSAPARTGAIAVDVMQPTIVQAEFQDAVLKLRELMQTHARTYRLEVGRYLLQRFYGGRSDAYFSRDPGKENAFTAFVQQHSEDLAGLALSENDLRRSIRVHVCFESLPAGVREQLSWSALLEVSKIGEANLRARVAKAAVDQQWTVAHTRAVVDQALANRVWDADPEQDGLQLPEPDAETPPQPGRLVRRSEKWCDEIDAWQAQFARIDAGKLDKRHVERLRAALARVRGQIQAVEKKLGGKAGR
jgi:hypothetical protein